MTVSVTQQAVTDVKVEIFRVNSSWGMKDVFLVSSGS